MNTRTDIPISPEGVSKKLKKDCRIEPAGSHYISARRIRKKCSCFFRPYENSTSDFLPSGRTLLLEELLLEVVLQHELIELSGGHP